MRDHFHRIEFSRDEAASQMLTPPEKATFGERAPKQVSLANAIDQPVAMGYLIYVEMR